VQQLEQLARDAAALAAGRAAETEASRQMTICNACRYCETFCAVFPAMTRRLEFGVADVHYLANLCHNCGACLHACQYAPPHEFAVNVPRAMAQVRVKTYEEFAWPRPFAAAYRSNGAVVTTVTALALIFFLVLGLAMKGSLIREPLAGNFYAVFPHNLMVAIFGAVFLFAFVALGVGAARFWRGEAADYDPKLAKGATAEAIRNVLTLKYLDGGHGDGCNDANDRFTLWRRRMHHFTFYGFMLCFAATSVATIYHYVFGWQAPYAFTSLPVILGTVGGVGLLVGPAGLLWLNLNRHKLHGDPSQRPMDVAFIGLLFFTSLTGLVLLVLRDTAAMPLLLAVHLGVVLALFALLPYGKFAHAVYRSAALLKYAIERRQPNRLQLGAD
jgi:citrate/tricarballylate utilization protein